MTDLEGWRAEHGHDLIGERCCGAECWAEWSQTPEKPCWGDIAAVAEEGAGDDYYWVHSCQGHEFEYFGSTYRPRPEGES
jgi:hypothetical protein